MRQSSTSFHDLDSDQRTSSQKDNETKMTEIQSLKKQAILEWPQDLEWEYLEFHSELSSSMTIKFRPQEKSI